MKKSKESIENLRTQLKSMNVIMETVNNEIELLMQNEAVKNYIHYKKQYDELKKENNNIIENITSLDQELQMSENNQLDETVMVLKNRYNK